MNDEVEELPLSGSQGLIWTGQQLQPDDPLYNMALAFEIHGQLDPLLFQAAFQALINNCDILRLIIIVEESQPRQKFLKKLDYQVELIDFSSETQISKLYNEWLKQRVVDNFDLSTLLFDSALIKLAADKYVWYFNQHHICTDASSTAIIYQAMQHYYSLARNGQLCQVQPLPGYQAYLQQELAAKETVQWQRATTYWTEKLKTGYQPSTFYRPVPIERRAQTERIHCKLGSERSKRLKELTGKAGFTAFTPELALIHLFLTTLFAFLYRITGNASLSIGTPTHNRTGPVFKKTAGLFIEIFPVLLEAEETDSFASLHKKVSRETQQMLINTAPGVSGSEHNRAFDVVLNFITATFGDFDGMPMQSEWIHAGYGDRNHLLRLQVHDFDRGDQFTLHFDLNCDTFVGIERNWVVEHFLSLLDAFLNDPEQLIDKVALVSSDGIPRLSPADKNLTSTATNVLEHFYQCVKKFPQHTAMHCQGKDLSYAEMNLSVNQLAQYLINQGISQQSVVAVCMDRSIELVITVWGILKTGAAYVPIDPAYPKERIDFILEDSASAALITRKFADTEIFSSSVKIISLDDVLHPAGETICQHFDTYIETDSLAYIIYTSGSTGQAKGVAVTHRGLENYISWARDFYLAGELLDFPLFTTLSFDLTVTSIYTPLTSGSRLVIYPESDNHVSAIQAVINDNAVDIIKLTPSHLALIQTLDLSSSRVKKLIVGGEDFKTDLARTIDRRFRGQIEIYNEYGPTEGTVACMIYRFDLKHDKESSVPIGRSIDNVEVYLLDRHLNPVPQGLIGEIVIAGAGVAKGYINDEKLTAERFVDNPFEPGQKMYASGDLGRWIANGEMLYLGRRDNQLKMRGVRIEPGEIEAVLTEYADIREAVVIPWKIEENSEQEDSKLYCHICGLSGKHPEAHLDGNQICRICRSNKSQPDKARGYFSNLDQLSRLLTKARAEKSGKYDCIMLLSGGKDSSYVLCKLVDMGMTPLVFTLDNGYISEGAKTNIRRLVDDLGLDLHIGKTTAMNAIFVESLKVHSNVCNGCFKTIYTLSMKLAHDLGINYIVTGLSRGQIFETRLADLFRHNIVDAKQIDRTIIEARKAYHRLDDQVSRNLDVSHFKQEEIFEQIQFIDFYRYCDVTLEQVLAYLKQKVGWVRPTDTGRSTNCLINEVGIYVHKKERGYHNYALPYSWDVRLGHKEVTAAREELDDQIDIDSAQAILNEIGYQGDGAELVTVAEDRLVAYYVANTTYPAEDIKEYLAARLPKEYLPAHLVKMEKLPLTQNGKVDREALPAPERFSREVSDDFIQPENAREKQLAEIWAAILRVEKVGRNDNFFDLGGDSILNIQIVALAQKQGLSITPQMIFDHPTVAELVKVVHQTVSHDIDQGTVTGEIPLTPIQHRFFKGKPSNWLHYNQAIVVEVISDIDESILQQAITHLIYHHDALRSCFKQQSGHWLQSVADVDAIDCVVKRIDLRDEPSERHDTIIDQQIAGAHAGFNAETGCLFKAVLLKRTDTESDFLLLIVHHLIVDGVSWWILMDDLEKLCEDLSCSKSVNLPAKTSSYQSWSRALVDYSNSSWLKKELDYWLQTTDSSNCLPFAISNLQQATASPQQLSVSLSNENTRLLLQDVPARYRSQIPEILMTALVQSVQSVYKETVNKTLYLAMEGHGRESLFEEINLIRTVGWFTSVYPLRLQIPESEDCSSVLRSVKEQMRAVPKRGIGFGILSYLSKNPVTREKLAALPKPELLFNYLGQWDQVLAKSSNFCFARPIIADIARQDSLTYNIEISAMIYKGCLQVDWHFDSGKYPESTINALAESFIAILQDIINHSVSASDNNALTPSDFPDADLDQGALDTLLDDFGE